MTEDEEVALRHMCMSMAVDSGAEVQDVLGFALEFYDFAMFGKRPEAEVIHLSLVSSKPGADVS